MFILVIISIAMIGWIYYLHQKNLETGKQELEQKNKNTDETASKKKFQNDKVSNKDEEYIRRYRSLLEQADNGDVYAMTVVADCLSKGVYQEKDLTKAQYYYKMAAEKGNAEGEFMYGFNLITGTGTDKNRVEGLKYIFKAAEHGNRDAQYASGLEFMSGSIDLPHKEKKACLYFENAAKQGHIGAQLELGKAYISGSGVEKDIKKSIFWFGCAFLQKDQDASKELEQLKNANIVERNMIEDTLEEIKKNFPEYIGADEKISAYVQRTWEQVWKQPVYERDYSEILNMPEKYLNSDINNHYLDKAMDDRIAMACVAFWGDEMRVGIRTVFFSVKEMEKFEYLKPKVDSYCESAWAFVGDNILNSLKKGTVIENLECLKNLSGVLDYAFESVDYYMQSEDAYKAQNYKECYEKLTMLNVDETVILGQRLALIYMALKSNEYEKEKDENSMFEFYQEYYKIVKRIYTLTYDDGNSQAMHPDILIAKIIELSYKNRIKEIEVDLKKLLEGYTKREELKDEVYDSLAEILGYYHEKELEKYVRQQKVNK